LVGPAGSEGAAGVAGAQGTTGQTGEAGITTAGVAGPAGPAGATGAQGPAGATGAQGVAGVVGGWQNYKQLWFDADKSDVQPSEAKKVAEIASYLKQNPSLEVGIDATENPRGNSQTRQDIIDLSDRRVKAVRESLIQAGVPSEKIKDGALGDSNLRTQRSVQVLFRTAT
jgi:outer membrane protein OmpA-like peptidoglycan-associated protein